MDKHLNLTIILNNIVTKYNIPKKEVQRGIGIVLYNIVEKLKENKRAVIPTFGVLTAYEKSKHRNIKRVHDYRARVGFKPSRYLWKERSKSSGFEKRELLRFNQNPNIGDYMIDEFKLAIKNGKNIKIKRFGTFFVKKEGRIKIVFRQGQGTDKISFIFS